MEQNVVDKMMMQALLAQRHAYAPYSNFQVGAAILTNQGNIYSGCNVECADYDGTHAEEAAICAMVKAGERAPVAIIVFGALEGQEPRLVKPCGKCRQKLYEFVSFPGQDLDVIVGLATLLVKHLKEYLPDAFGPADVGVNPAKYLETGALKPGEK